MLCRIFISNYQAVHWAAFLIDDETALAHNKYNHSTKLIAVTTRRTAYVIS